MEPPPLVRTPELGDVPAPDWLAPVATSSGLRWAGWRATRRRSTHLVTSSQQPVHGRDRAQVGPLVKEGGPDLGRCHVAEALGVKHLGDRFPLGPAQGPWRPRPRRRRALQRRDGGAGSGWPGTGRGPHRPLAAPPSEPAPRRLGRESRLGLVGVRALRELLQERVHSSLDLDDGLGLGQLGLQPGVLLGAAARVRPGSGRLGHPRCVPRRPPANLRAPGGASRTTSRRTGPAGAGWPPSGPARWPAPTRPGASNAGERPTGPGCIVPGHAQVPLPGAPAWSVCFATRRVTRRVLCGTSSRFGTAPSRR